MSKDNKCDKCIYNDKKRCGVNFCIMPFCIKEGKKVGDKTQQIRAKAKTNQSS